MYSVINYKGYKLISSDGQNYQASLPGSGGDLINDNFISLANAINIEKRTLSNSGGDPAYDWENCHIFFGGQLLIEGNERSMYDSNNWASVDWENRALYDNVGGSSITYGTANKALWGKINGADSAAIAWASGTARLANLASDPPALAGCIYYNTTTGRVRVFRTVASGWLDL